MGPACAVPNSGCGFASACAAGGAGHWRVDDDARLGSVCQPRIAANRRRSNLHSSALQCRADLHARAVQLRIQLTPERPSGRAFLHARPAVIHSEPPPPAPRRTLQHRLITIPRLSVAHRPTPQPRRRILQLRTLPPQYAVPACLTPRRPLRCCSPIIPRILATPGYLYPNGRPGLGARVADAACRFPPAGLLLRDSYRKFGWTKRLCTAKESVASRRTTSKRRRRSPCLVYVEQRLFLITPGFGYAHTLGRRNRKRINCRPKPTTRFSMPRGTRSRRPFSARSLEFASACIPISTRSPTTASASWAERWVCSTIRRYLTVQFKLRHLHGSHQDQAVAGLRCVLDSRSRHALRNLLSAAEIRTPLRHDRHISMVVVRRRGIRRWIVDISRHYSGPNSAWNGDSADRPRSKTNSITTTSASPSASNGCRRRTPDCAATSRRASPPIAKSSIAFSRRTISIYPTRSSSAAASRTKTFRATNPKR